MLQLTRISSSFIHSFILISFTNPSVHITIARRLALQNSELFQRFWVFQFSITVAHFSVNFYYSSDYIWGCFEYGFDIISKLAFLPRGALCGSYCLSYVGGPGDFFNLIFLDMRTELRTIKVILPYSKRHAHG